MDSFISRFGFHCMLFKFGSVAVDLSKEVFGFFVRIDSGLDLGLFSIP